GGSGTDSPRQGHRGHGRVASRDEAGRSRGRTEPRADITDIALSTNAHRDRDGAEHDHRVSTADGPSCQEWTAGGRGWRATISGPALRRHRESLDRRRRTGRASHTVSRARRASGSATGGTRAGCGKLVREEGGACASALVPRPILRTPYFLGALTS